jgi:hypothetical protein
LERYQPCSVLEETNANFAALSLIANILRALHFGTKFTVWYWVPLSPCRLQNLENKGLKLSLCARSLSLQELHAKSRQHGSYGCACRARLSVLGIVPPAYKPSSHRWGFSVLAPFPMAYAMGCILSPLCSCNRCRLREGTRPDRIVKDQTLSTG